MGAFFLIVYCFFSLQNSLFSIILKSKLLIHIKKKAPIGYFSFSKILVYQIFSFKEDLKAQRGLFEDEKNIKGWGVHNANTKNGAPNVPTSNFSPLTPLQDL